MIDALLNDTDDSSVDATSVSVVTGPVNGTHTIDSVTGEITYTHDGTDTTSDSLTYTVLDIDGVPSNIATVSIFIGDETNQAVQFDGVNDWVNIPNLTFPGDFTVEGWMSIAPGLNQYDVLFGRVGPGQNFNFFSGRPPSVRPSGRGDRSNADES